VLMVLGLAIVVISGIMRFMQAPTSGNGVAAFFSRWGA
jgi:hypothetical protein